MTLSGTDISTLGLKLLKLTDYYNLPARKRILSEPAFGPNDIKYEPRRAVVKLFGKYDTQEDLATAVAGFETLIKSETQHAVSIDGHNLSFMGAFANGFRAEIKRNAVIIEATINLIEASGVT